MREKKYKNKNSGDGKGSVGRGSGADEIIVVTAEHNGRLLVLQCTTSHLEQQAACKPQTVQCPAREGPIAKGQQNYKVSYVPGSLCFNGHAAYELQS